MHQSDHDAGALTPEQSRRAIHATMERARSSLYVAGTTPILLLWGVIASLGYLAEYALATLAEDLEAAHPWIHAPLWGLLVAGDLALAVSSLATLAVAALGAAWIHSRGSV